MVSQSRKPKAHVKNPHLMTVPPNRDEMYFCKGYDYWGKVGLSKGYWNPKRKMLVTTDLSEIIKQELF